MNFKAALDKHEGMNRKRSGEEWASTPYHAIRPRAFIYLICKVAQEADGPVDEGIRHTTIATGFGSTGQKFVKLFTARCHAYECRTENEAPQSICRLSYRLVIAKPKEDSGKTYFMVSLKAVRTVALQALK